MSPSATSFLMKSPVPWPITSLWLLHTRIRKAMFMEMCIFAISWFSCDLHSTISQLNNFTRPTASPRLSKSHTEMESRFPSNIPARAVLPLSLGKAAEEFILTDARVLLSDFGEPFNPTDNPRRSEDCHTPLASRPPEALFQPKAPLSFSADIWSLATSIWEILGMKAIFSGEYSSAEELASEI